VIGEHLVAARPLDGSGERQRAGDLELEEPFMTARDLLGRVEVLGDERPCPAEVGPFANADAPAVGLQVRVEAFEDCECAADHAGMHAAGGELRDVREIADFTQDEPERLGEIGARHRADAGGTSHENPCPEVGAVTWRPFSTVDTSPTHRRT
jgi:hypothetical protein